MSRDGVSGAAFALAAVAALAGGAALRRGGRAIRLGSSREHDEARRVALQRGNKLYTVYGKSAQQATDAFEKDTGRKAVRVWVAPEALLEDAWIEYVVEAAPPSGSRSITTSYTDKEYEDIEKVLKFSISKMNEIQVKALLEEGRLISPHGDEVERWDLVRLSIESKRGRSVSPSRTLLSGTRVGPALLKVSGDGDLGESFGVPWIEAGYSSWRIPSGVQISEEFEDEEGEGDDE